MPDEYYLDAEITKYGGRISPGRSPAGPTSAPFDLDAEIAKYGGQRLPRPSAQAVPSDPLAALRQSNPSLCREVEAFANGLGATVDRIVPRGALDPCMAGGMSWSAWERLRLDRAFRMSRTAMAEARAREEEERAERAAWREKWRTVAHGWAKWARWRRQSPQMADVYRHDQRDADGGDQDWLVDFASRTVPRAKTSAATVTRKSTKRR
jgi:hypothetical protein